MINRNLEPGYWDGQWSGKGVRKFPIWTMNRIAHVTPEGSTVLDIGCGNGAFMERLEKNIGCKTYGIDISGEAIRQLRERGLKGEEGNAENLDHVQGLYDVVMSAHLFEHVEAHENLAKNVGRLTKKYAIIAVPDNCSFPEHTGQHVRKYTKESLRELLEEHGGFTEFENFHLSRHLIYRCSR